MNALRIRKRLDAPIPELPELTPLIGKDLEIIVLEETAAAPDPDSKGSSWKSKSAQEMADDRGVKPIQSIEQLRDEEFADAFDGFDEAIDELRKRPWRAGDE